MTQTQAVLQHLKDCGSITSWEAIMHYGATRLSGIIYNLKKAGYNIIATSIQVKNRYGHFTNVAKYILKEDVK